MSGHGVLMLACDQCRTMDDNVQEVQGEMYCSWCRDQMRTCDACGEPMRDAQTIEGDETGQYRVCSSDCVKVIVAEVACTDCQRITADANDMRTIEYWCEETGRWEGGLYCSRCRP